MEIFLLVESFDIQMLLPWHFSTQATIWFSDRLGHGGLAGPASMSYPIQMGVGWCITFGL